MRSRHVSRVIAAPPKVVYALASDPRRLPDWAAGLAQGEVRVDGDTLRVDSPMGTVSVRFIGANDLGVLDHEVALPDGGTVLNACRVLGHPEGSEIVFTLRQLDLTDEEFERDAATVQADLERLAALVEERADDCSPPEELAEVLADLEDPATMRDAWS